MKLEFSRQIVGKDSNISSFMKIRRLGADLYMEGQTDARTDTTMLIVDFRNFANTPSLRFYKECSYMNLSVIGNCES